MLKHFLIISLSFTLIGCATISDKVGSVKAKASEIGVTIDNAQLDWLESRIKRKDAFECRLYELGFKIEPTVECKDKEKSDVE